MTDSHKMTRERMSDEQLNAFRSVSRPRRAWVLELIAEIDRSRAVHETTYRVETQYKAHYESPCGSLREYPWETWARVEGTEAATWCARAATHAQGPFWRVRTVRESDNEIVRTDV